MNKTEETILTAAIDLFTKKGYDATTTRDIAEAADINIASLHYYYRSKEKLFQRVIGEQMITYSKLMDTILNSDRPLHEKIYAFVPAEIDFLMRNPQLSMFILSESHRNADKMGKMLESGQTMNRLEEQLNELAAQKVIRPISVANFMANLVGLTVFPFLAKPLLSLKADLDDAGYNAMLEERKKLVPDMILRQLYFDPPIR